MPLLMKNILTGFTKIKKGNYIGFDPEKLVTIKMV